MENGQKWEKHHDGTSTKIGRAVYEPARYIHTDRQAHIKFYLIHLDFLKIAHSISIAISLTLIQRVCKAHWMFCMAIVNKLSLRIIFTKSRNLTFCNTWNFAWTFSTILNQSSQLNRATINDDEHCIGRPSTICLQKNHRSYLRWSGQSVDIGKKNASEIVFFLWKSALMLMGNSFKNNKAHLLMFIVFYCKTFTAPLVTVDESMIWTSYQ